MTDRSSRTVYSTGAGRVCPTSELKRACGAGGVVVENSVEIQGDLRERIRGVLAKKGWTVKG